MHINYCKDTASDVAQFAHEMVGQMQSRDILQKQLAYETGWTRSRVSRVLSGIDQNLTLDTMMHLAAALGLRMVISYEPEKSSKRVKSDIGHLRM